MKPALSLVLLVMTLTPYLSAHTRIYQRGTVVRMRMTQCIIPHSDVRASLSGTPMQNGGESCQQYILVSQNVVYEVVGKQATDLIPLAENIDFRLQKNELLVRLDDARHETRYYVVAMTLRSDWERQELERQKDMHRAGRSPETNAQMRGATE